MAGRYGIRGFFPALLCLVLSWNATAWAASLELLLPEVEADASGTVTAPVKVKDGAGFGALQMDLVFDPSVVEVTAVEAGALLSNGLVEFNASQGRCVIGIVSSDPVVGGGDIVTVTMRTRGNPGGSSALTAQNAQAWENESRAPMNVAVVDGKIRMAGKTVGMPAWMWGGLAIVILGGGAFCCVRSRRKSPRPAPVAQTPKGKSANYCSNCGDQLNAGMKFCPNCGAKIEE
jgi:hypothetical protein